MLSRCFLDFSVGVRASVIGLSQISSFSFKNLIKIYEPCFNNGITSTNIPLKAEYDIVW